MHRDFFKKRMNRAIMLLLAVMMLFPLACSRNERIGDEKVFDLFMNAVANEQYAEAYSFISALTASDAPEGIARGNTISLLEFEELYSRLFSVFSLERLEYSITSDTLVSGTKRKIEYNVKYFSEEAGELSYDCEVQLTEENGVWRLLFEPSCVLPSLDWGESFSRSTLVARRGDILTRDGTLIAGTEELVTVYAVLSELIETETLIERVMQQDGVDERTAQQRLSGYLARTESLHRLCGTELNELRALIGMVIPLSEEETAEKMMKSVVNDFLLIKQLGKDELEADALDALDALPGVRVDTKNYGSTRVYPYGSLLAHNLGYVGHPDADEVRSLNEDRDKNDGLYTTDSIVGKSGIERLYEKELRGRDGYYYYIKNADGSVKEVLSRREKEDGLDVRLTIDFDLQKRTEELLDVVLFGDDTAGAVIVMDPKTGAVEASASYPTYDLNKFVTGFTSEEYEALSTQKNTPMLDRTKRGLYPPGSTFKAFTAAAALDTGTMNENYEFTGYIENDYWTPRGYGTWVWPSIKRTKVNARSLPLNMTNCMLHSDNIYFANAALKIGAERFMEYLRGLGMEQKLPFELTCSNSQILRQNDTMNYKLLADSGYGQGQILVTPLQLTTMFCAFRNGGDLPVPYITDGMFKSSGVSYECIKSTEPSTWIENAMSEAAISRITPMLQGVVDPSKNGTGRQLRVRDCAVAGKTGSAEIGGDKERIISWFAGFRLDVPSEDERVVVVMLEIPDTDRYTSLKFQIARQLLKLSAPPDPNAAN